MTTFPTTPIPRVLYEYTATADASRGYTFVGEDGRSEEFFSFADMSDRVAQYGAALLALGLKQGENVAMIIPDGQQFVFTFLGAMHVGLVPVPMCPPATLGKLTNYLGTTQFLVQKSEAAALICTSDIKRIIGSIRTPDLRRIVSVDDLPVDGTRASLANVSPDSPAFIQFTSGSTSRPKGVVLSHANLAANAHCIMTLGLNATPEDVGCTWLPFYHDMGLIGFVIAPLTTQTPVAFMQPLSFLKRPVDWLRMVSRHRGTIGFSPNFAYGLSTSRIKDKDLEGLDLSSWRIAGCGAEPIQLATLERFAERFECVGFKPEFFMPCFGMAESTLAVSFHDLSERPRAQRLRMDRLTRDAVAEPADAVGDFETAEFVSCGRPFEGHDVRIRLADGSFAEENCVGEVVLRGPSVMKGYYKDQKATDAAIQDGWLHTGDKGYLSNGELYVCGRIKDMIIVAGKNYYPTDIEWAAGEITGIRRGNVVAFGTGAFGSAERVVVAAELKTTDPDVDALSKAIKSAVLEQVGVRVDEVVLLDAGAIPKTTSGKLQRAATKALYEEGKLEANARQDTRVDLARNVVASQLGLLRSRIRSTFTSSPS
jgi:acyl-CoA synthetase (AMP-forming)/AMP-acid ligase II